jgi:hypothetical protein
MKRLILLAGLVIIGALTMAQDCRLTHIALTSIDGHDTFAGELENESGVDILNHRFQVAFLNDNLAIVEIRIVDGCLRSLQHGTSDFFSVSSTLPDTTTEVALARMANLSEDPDFSTGNTEASDIALTEIEAERTGGSLSVTGTITNHDDDLLEEPAVCVVVFDEDGNVITTAKDESVEDLSAGGDSDSFAVEIAVPDDEELVDHIQVWADGLEDDTPVEPSFADEEMIGLTPTATPSPSSTATPAPTATPTP